MYLPRTITKSLEQASRHFPVVLITGPRQIGKTTCLKESAKPNRSYVTLDDPQARELAVEDPKLFLQRFPPPVLIDEIQYAPALLPIIKMAVDEGAAKGSFWLTGSQQFHLMSGVTESLAGRVGILHMLGFSMAEQLGEAEKSTPFLPGAASNRDHRPIMKLPEVYERIWRGSFPAVWMEKEMDRDLFYGSYVQTYLQRDVKALVQVGDELAFIKFLRAAAARTGQLLNLADISRDAGIAHNTARHWLSVLQSSGLVYLLEPFHINQTKRLVKAPKLYFMDTGLAAYLTQWSSPATLEAGAANGAFFETWALSEILKSYWHNGKQAPFTFYRDHDQREVDLLIFKDGHLYPVGFKKASSPGKKDIQTFSVLKQLKHPVGEGAVVCMTDRPMPLTESVTSLPVGHL
ncbi:MAG: ATP-binding protein [Kiritimatiellia bacterium]